MKEMYKLYKLLYLAWINWFLYFSVLKWKFFATGGSSSSETQGQSVGSGEKAGQKFSSTGE